MSNNQYVLFQKFDKSVERGDIVVYKKEGKKTAVCIVIGLPGEKVEIRNGTYFVNDKPLENISYNLKEVSSLQPIEIPANSFFCYITLAEKSQIEDHSLYIRKNSDIIGKLIYPRRKITIEKYTKSDGCNGYPPISCPADAKYHCPAQGKPFCCREELINGICPPCPAGESLAQGNDGRIGCCKKELICDGLCYPPCFVGEKFHCSPKRGGYCYTENSIFCNNEYWRPCLPGEKFHCPKSGDPFCYDAKHIICNDRAHLPCPAGQKFRCSPQGGYCEN